VSSHEAASDLLVAEGLHKAYGDLVALEPLDLRIAEGEAVALVGHNGSGKSTFLRMVAGLLEPTDGWVTVGGAAAGTVDARAATSYLPDEPVLYDDLSVREHLAYVSALHGADPPDDEVLERLGLLDRADDLPARFSRGLRQKAAIAVGLCRPFRLLLVDEPFVGLDAPGKEAMLGLLAEVNGAGAAIVVATHDPEFVDRVTRCIALRDGAVVHDGAATPADVLRLVGS
jgi:ABC-type multidrug transport system ATPase subunit